jgi:nucleoside phosphorylase
MATLSHDDYHIGIICALPKERTAVEAMLDEKHSRLKNKHLDNNTYSYGRIDEHNVVIASLGKGKYGTVSAANVAADIRRSFPSMRYGFMVGIAGGMPHVERAEETEREAEQDVHERKPKAKRQEGDIRLGDIVVGAVQGVPSVINYGLGKEDIDGGFDIRSQLAEPPAAITTAIAALEADHVREGPTYLHHLEKLLSNDRYNTPEVEDDYYDMPESPDQLFEADPNTGQERLVKRPVRFLRRPPSDLNLERRMNFIRARDGKFFDYPKVHYGSIASADRLIKNRKARDLWYDRIKEQTKAKVLCFEMEASGIVKGWPCLVVRGICDYCDSHKNDDWQNFAAAVAAAYTKDLLCRIAPSEIVRAKPANEVISQSE